MMGLIAKFLARPAVTNWLIRRATKTPYYHITSSDGSEVYMYRYWLFNPYPLHSSGKKNWFPISIRLHHIMRKDHDRDMHDHPWNARTFILRGSYTEVRPYIQVFDSDGVVQYSDDKLYERHAGQTATLKYGEYHRILQVSDGGVWTMFITGKYRGTWGFLVNGVKVRYRKYLGLDPVQI